MSTPIFQRQYLTYNKFLKLLSFFIFPGVVRDYFFSISHKKSVGIKSNDRGGQFCQTSANPALEKKDLKMYEARDEKGVALYPFEITF